ncbi:MAG: SGNH/GDSL hydrolase family protein [Acidobacteriota bacterium]|nr:SGNH/GDSL hydrolase family protein [Acidobacteriota bacterium]
MTFRRLLLLALSVAALCFGQDGFYLKTGDRVVFYGDSITDQRLYTTFTETYVLTRFPELRVAFIHSGWGGDRVTGGGGGPVDVRLQRDVLAYRPTVMTIMLGMNDGGYRAFDTKLFDTFSTGYQHIVDTVRSTLPDIRITAIEPSPFDDVTRPPKFEGGYNAVLLRYSEFIKQLAQRDKLTVADLNTPVVLMLAKATQSDPELAQKILPDRVHPGPAGHLIMAEALLKAWNAPPIVTSVEIDAQGSGKIAAHANTEISDLKQGGTLSWTQLDRALPMPVDMKDATVALAIHSSDFMDALDKETLKVANLPGAKYSLKIDGMDAGAFTKEEWARGINLATLPTPMMQQAASVHVLTQKRSNVHNARWRMIQVPLQDENILSTDAAIAALDDVDIDLMIEQRAAAQPVPRHYQLIAQPAAH